MRHRAFRGSLVLFGVAAALFMTTVPGTGAAFRNVKEGDPAAVVALKGIDGSDIEIKGVDGKVVVIAFVDVTQDRSVAMLKDLSALSGELAEKGVEFFVVAKYTNNADEARKVSGETGIKAPIALDTDQKAYDAYGLFILPSVGVIGKDGKLAFESTSHGRDFKDIVGGKIKVLAGVLSEEDYKSATVQTVTVQKSKEENEADRQLTLGKTLMKRNMVEKAADHFAKAVAADPKNNNARLALGEALIVGKKFEEAKPQFEEVLKLDEKNKEAQVGMGTVLLGTGDVDGALKILSDAAMLNPKPERANYWLGAAYEKKGDFENAAKMYRKVAEKMLKE